MTLSLFDRIMQHLLEYYIDYAMDKRFASSAHILTIAYCINKGAGLNLAQIWCFYLNSLFEDKFHEKQLHFIRFTYPLSKAENVFGKEHYKNNKKYIITQITSTYYKVFICAFFVHAYSAHYSPMQSAYSWFHNITNWYQ